MNIWTREYYLSHIKADPKPPYKVEEVPSWWPDFLRSYLTEVSREVCYRAPYVIELDEDPTLTLEQRRHKIREKALAEIEECGGPEEFFEWDIKHSFTDTNTLMSIHLENEEFDALNVVVYDGGCTFSDRCDLRTGKIYYHCGDDRDSGVMYYHMMYKDYMPTAQEKMMNG